MTTNTSIHHITAPKTVMTIRSGLPEEKVKISVINNSSFCVVYNSNINVLLSRVLKIVLHIRCQIPRLVKKTPPQSTVATGGEYVVDPRNESLVSHQICGLNAERSPRMSLR